MFAASVCLSRGSYRLHCAKKMVEQIKMLFGVNTPGNPCNIVLDGGPGPPTKRGGDPVLNVGTHLLSEERQQLETSKFACV